MRRYVSAVAFILLPITLAACTQSRASRLDDRTFSIEGPGVPGGSDAPNRRVAEQICPHGYRVLDEKRFKPDPNLPIATNWTIRCL
jgi:hypothetical protein